MLTVYEVLENTSSPNKIRDVELFEIILECNVKSATCLKKCKVHALVKVFSTFKYFEYFEYSFYSLK